MVNRASHNVVRKRKAMSPAHSKRGCKSIVRLWSPWRKYLWNFNVCDGCNIIAKQSSFRWKLHAGAIWNDFHWNFQIKDYLATFKTCFLPYQVFSKGLLKWHFDKRNVLSKYLRRLGISSYSSSAELLAKVSTYFVLFHFRYYKYHSCYSGSPKSFYC